MESTPSEKVAKFIDDNFENVDNLTIEDFPLLPYGKRIIDKDGGEMVVYWDFMRERVICKIPVEGRCNDER
jgi:hypothetical protein